MITTIFTQDVVKEEIIETLKNVPELSSYFVDGESPVLELFSSQLASILSKKAFYINQVKNENFIQTAQQPDNKYFLAKSFGYRINRYGCAKIKMTYKDFASGVNPQTITMNYGDVVGSYNGEDIIFIGESSSVERDDELLFAIGKRKSYSGGFNFDDDESLVNVLLYPEELLSIDNEEVKLYINQKESKMSRDLEDFIIKDVVVDFSDSNTVSSLYVYDYRSLYGVSVDANDVYEVIWVETDGKKDSFDESKIDLFIDGQFVFKEVSTLGYSCDSLQKLSYLPIFYYRTMRRAVTDEDYKFILLAYPLFKDISIFSKDITNKFIFYIHSDTLSNDVHKLTEYESEKVDEYINFYKMSGVQLYFVPAKPVDLKFDATVKLFDASKISYVREEVRKIVEKYTLKFFDKVELGDILAEISKIEYEGEKIISFVYPNENSVELYDLKEYEYLQLKDEDYHLEIL